MVRSFMLCMSHNNDRVIKSSEVLVGCICSMHGVNKQDMQQFIVELHMGRGHLVDLTVDGIILQH